jgi:hypothetical protein
LHSSNSTPSGAVGRRLRFHRIDLRLHAFALLAMAACTSALAKPGSVGFTYVRIGKWPVFVVSADLRDPDVKVTPMLSRGGIGSAESHRSMLHRTAPTAAITGTFFCTRTLIPTGDIVLGGRMVHYGGVGTGLCVTPDNLVYFVPRQKYRHVDWTGYESVLCAGPRLLWDGRVCVAPKAEGFRDRRMIYSRVPRLGVGVTSHRKLLLVLVKRPCYLSELARVMRALGCMDAVDVDQGSSTTLYYRGWCIARPKRGLTNILVVYDSRAKYDAAMHRAAPWYASVRSASG